jgi:hypothetical protein
MRKLYEEGILYCPKCKQQPECFHEMMAEHVNRVPPDAALIDPESEKRYVMEYQSRRGRSTIRRRTPFRRSRGPGGGRASTWRSFRHGRGLARSAGTWAGR